MKANIPRYAAQIAAGSGDANDAYSGDAGAMHHNDVSWATADYQPADASPAAAVLSPAKTPSKLRRSVADAGTVTRASNAGDALRASVLDGLSQFNTLQEDITSRAASVAQRSHEANLSIVARLKTFDDKFLYTNRVGFTVQRLIDETKLQMDLEFQRRFGPVVQVDPEVFTSVLTELSADRVSDEELYRGRIQRNITTPMFPFGDGAIPQLLLSVNAFALTDVLADTTAKLAAAAEQADALTQQIDAVDAELRLAMNREDLVAADELERRLQKLSLERFELFTQRVRLIGSGDASVGVSAKLTDVMNAPALPGLTADKEGMKRAILSDVDILERDRVKRNQVNSAAINAYNAACQRSTDQLQKNFYQQQQVWLEVERGLARVAELGEDARQLADARLEATEVEQKRRTEFAEYQDSYARHRQYEADLLDNTAAALDFIEGVQEFLVVGQGKVQDMRVEERLHAITVRERAGMEEAFAHVGDVSVRRLYKATVRATNADRLVVEMRHQLHEAALTDDPDHQAHARRLAELEALLLDHRAREQEQDDVFAKLQRSFTASAAECEDPDAPEAAGESPLVAVLAQHAQLLEGYTAQLGGLMSDFNADAARLRADVDAKDETIAVMEEEQSVRRKRREGRRSTVDAAAAAAEEPASD
jgi:hypothetical protein